MRGSKLEWSRCLSVLLLVMAAGACHTKQTIAAPTTPGGFCPSSREQDLPRGSRGRLHGIVRQPDTLRGIPGITLTMTVDGRGEWSTITDRAGNYSFDDLPAGEAVIRGYFSRLTWRCDMQIEERDYTMYIDWPCPQTQCPSSRSPSSDASVVD